MIWVRRSAPSSPIHAAPLDLQTRPSAEIRTACGEMLPIDEVEQASDPADNPCCACATLAIDEQPTDPGQEPESTPNSGGYAVALHGSHVRHLVADGAARGELHGRPVVQTLCSRLAWGPLGAGPQHWPLREQCQGHSAESA